MPWRKCYFMQRCDGSLLFLAQINYRTSKVRVSLDCESKFDLSKVENINHQITTRNVSCLYLSSVILFVLSGLALQRKPAGLGSLVHIKLRQRKTDLPQELVHPQEVPVEDSQGDVGRVTVQRDRSESKTREVSPPSGDYSQLALLTPVHALGGLLLHRRLILLLAQTNRHEGVIGS